MDYPLQPLATLQSNKPEDVHAYITKLLHARLNDDSSDRITTDQETWVTVLSGITDFMFVNPPDRAPWSTFRQKIEMLENSMEVIQRASARVDGLFFQAGNLAHQLLTRLLDIGCVFEVWDYIDESRGGELSTPQSMKEKAFQAMLIILRALGDSNSTIDMDQPMWEVLRLFVVEILDDINDLITRPGVLTSANVVFFKKLYPREEEHLDRSRHAHSAKNKSPFEVKLESPFILNTFLVRGLEIITQALSLPLLSQVFMSDLIRIIPETTRLVFNFFLSPACSAVPNIRHKLLTQLVTNATPVYQRNPGFCGPLIPLPYRLLQFRIQEGQKINLDEAEFNEIKPVIPSPMADITSALELIQTPAGEYSKPFLISYLRNNIPYCNLESLTIMKRAIEAVDLGPNQKTLVADLEQREREISEGDLSHVPANAAGVLAHWKQQVQSIVQEILGQDDIMWADEASREQLAPFVLHHLQVHFERSPGITEPAFRVLLAKRLGDLICLLAHCEGPKCSDSHEIQFFTTISPCLPIIVRLLDGPDDEVTGEVRRWTYAALVRIIRHHSWKSGYDGLEQVTEIAFRGIMDRDRSARLRAGNALGTLIHMMRQNEQNIEALFERLYRHYDNGKLWTKETIIISIGLMGRSSDQEVVAQALCFLIAQLGSQYPPLKGSAYMQIDAIKQKHSKSVFSLLGHHMDRVAPFLVSRYCTQPALITEACRLMSMSTATFISMTRPKTYPQLFANCEFKVLQRIAKELEVPIHGLYFPDAAQILACVFQLQGTGQTKKALDFIGDMVANNLEEGTVVTGKQLVKMCLAPLLAELVVEMGYEHKAAIAVTALKRIERMIAPTSANGNSPPAPELGVFLKQHALGLISHLSDMLQDVQTKATLPRKCAILRSMGSLSKHIGRSISNIAPQYMSTFQTMLVIPELAEVTLESWYIFLTTLEPNEIGSHVGSTTAALISSWPSFSPTSRKIATKLLDHIIIDAGKGLGQHLDDIIDLSIIPELGYLCDHLKGLQNAWTTKERLQRILDRASSDNLAVAFLALRELKSFILTEQPKFIRELASGDVFNPIAGQIMATLLAAACRDGERAESLRLLAFEIIGVFGAVDPDRFDISVKDPSMIVLNNFTDEAEAILFTMHLIQDLLIGVFRATSDVSYQRHLGYALQQLLRVCQFTPSLIANGIGGPVPVKVRNRWNSFPKHVLETLSPLLDAKFAINSPAAMSLRHPIYRGQSTYREWIQLWTCHLITKSSGAMANNIFGPFFSIVRNKDVVVAYHILPHLILNILLSGHEDDADAIRLELLAILEDQVNPDSDSSTDKKLLSAQAVFMILDHLNKWVRLVRQDVNTKKADSKRSRANQVNSNVEEQVLRVDSILSSIDQNLMARAALQCKAYARSFMNFESQIISLKDRESISPDLPIHYERLHEIYSYLDEPDGMEGVSTLILSPSLEHQIRRHESTGRWTSAQSCWEVRLQQSPDNLDFHLGLLRCLRNLGHYDTLRTHVRGVLIRNPEWESTLAGFQVESAWMVGAWEDVKNMVENSNAQSSSIVMARLLLAMRAGDSKEISESMSIARSLLGAPITAAGVRGYRRSYEAALDLHLTHELELIHNVLTDFPPESQTQARNQALSHLSRTLSARFDSTLSTFRTREPILSLRRTAFTLSLVSHDTLVRELGRSWLASAKIARKAGHWQTAYSALLQAKQMNAVFSFMQSAKLVKAMGEPLRAVQELENSMRMLGILDDSNVLDLTGDDEETQVLKAKAQVLRARWMHESDRYDDNLIFKTFTNATQLRPNWESGQFRLGQFHDECYKALPQPDQASRGLKMILYTIRSFSKAIRVGSKYVFQTVPRLLTIWLDLGEDKTVAGTDIYKKINDIVARAIKEAPVYKWYTAFPQIVSRIGHTNPEVFKVLSKLITRVIEEYPRQALWLFTSVAKSTKSNREQRGRAILDQLRNNPSNAKTEIPRLITQCIAMTNELLHLCDYHIDDDSRKTLTMKDFPRLAALGKSPLIIPLQESLTASLPPTSSSESTHQPFPSNAPTFEKFFDEIDIMRSLAKPRKITIQGSDGQVYMFLGKPKDDLRKDARLMDFNAFINKLLKANSESRRRQLHVRTYGVVTLNEECGIIQWVPNTIPIRPVLIKSYEARRIRPWTSEMNDIFKKIKDAKDKDAADIFLQKILPMFPPVFHDWFVETFPEPTAWLASRLAYGRTAAVMSMVGFILGLGDRHCENILLDSNTGDTIHVDFNCLFEKGKSLETPERVPFRLTQNLVDGLGVTGVEGVFRIACEVTLQLLRDNKDSLMSVLDAFIHDPLVEWEDEKRKIERSERLRRNNLKASVDLHKLARDALSQIEKKLKGIYLTSKERQEREISTSNLVQVLIQEATDPAGLAKMYPGWAAWH